MEQQRGEFVGCSVIVAVDPNTSIDVIPGSNRWLDSCDTVSRPIPSWAQWRRIPIPVGTAIVFRGDLVHRGVEYEEEENFRLFITCPFRISHLTKTVFVPEADGLGYEGKLLLLQHTHWQLLKFFFGTPEQKPDQEEEEEEEVEVNEGKLPLFQRINWQLLTVFFGLQNRCLTRKRRRRSTSMKCWSKVTEETCAPLVFSGTHLHAHTRTHTCYIHTHTLARTHSLALSVHKLAS